MGTGAAASTKLLLTNVLLLKFSSHVSLKEVKGWTKEEEFSHLRSQCIANPLLSLTLTKVVFPVPPSPTVEAKRDD